MVMSRDSDVVYRIGGCLTGAVSGDGALVAIEADLNVIDVIPDTALPIFGVGLAIKGNDAVGARGESRAKVVGALERSIVPAGEVILLTFVHD